jgi:hypothetical protein
VQEDEGEDDDTPSAYMNGSMKQFRSMLGSAETPESPLQQQSPLKPSGGSAVGSMAVDVEEEVEHIARMQARPAPLTDGRLPCFCPPLLSLSARWLARERCAVEQSERAEGLMRRAYWAGGQGCGADGGPAARGSGTGGWPERETAGRPHEPGAVPDGLSRCARLQEPHRRALHAAPALCHAPVCPLLPLVHLSPLPRPDCIWPCRAASKT